MKAAAQPVSDRRAASGRFIPFALAAIATLGRRVLAGQLRTFATADARPWEGLFRANT